MLGTLATILLVASLILGGGGITVAAAQSSLPDQALYPVKTWSEDVRTELTNNEQNRMELALTYASRRAEEMQMMLRAGQVPPESLLTRMQSEIDSALRLAAAKPDQDVAPALDQIRERLQKNNQVLQQAGEPAQPEAVSALEQTRSMLRDRLQWCEDGLQDPAVLRNHLREREREQEHDGSSDLSTPTMKATGTGEDHPRQTGTPAPGSDDRHGPGDEDGTRNYQTTATPNMGGSGGPGDDNSTGGDHGSTPGSDDRSGSDSSNGSNSGSDSSNDSGSGSDTSSGGSDSGSGGSDSGSGGSDSGSGGSDGGSGGSDSGSGGSDSGSGGIDSGSGGSDSGSGGSGGGGGH